jgi:hypothetical protein
MTYPYVCSNTQQIVGLLGSVLRCCNDYSVVYLDPVNLLAVSGYGSEKIIPDPRLSSSGFEMNLGI